MQIAFHLGAHCTDEDRLVRALLKNAGALKAQGIVVPHPRDYRLALRDRLIALKGAAAGPDDEASLRASMTDLEAPKRMIFSHDFFMGVASRALNADGFYAHSGRRVAAMRGLMPSAKPEVFMALRNPLTLLPALVKRIEGGSLEALLEGVRPDQLRWAPVVERMVAENPGTRVVIWCHEDTSLIWPEVLHAVSGAPETMALEGVQDMMALLLTPDGLARLTDYLASHPPVNGVQRQKIFSAFLEKFANKEAVETEVSFPGWSREMMEDLTASYEADLLEISAMPGVQVIAP